MQITELITSYQDLLPEPSDHAEIIRLVAPDYHPEAIEFKLGDVLGGDDPIDLQPFDTARILGRYEADPPNVFEITKLHPGEKISEILVDDTTETLCPTQFAKIGMISSEPFDAQQFSQKLTELEEASWQDSAQHIYEILRKLNIGFRSR
jgi:hypothetical protein